MSLSKFSSSFRVIILLGLKRIISLYPVKKTRKSMVDHKLMTQV